MGLLGVVGPTGVTYVQWGRHKVAGTLWGAACMRQMRLLRGAIQRNSFHAQCVASKGCRSMHALPGLVLWGLSFGRLQRQLCSRLGYHVADGFLTPRRLHLRSLLLFHHA